MNSSNLIKLGALAQKKFDMLDNFSIMAIPSDTPHCYRIAIRNDIDYGYGCVDTATFAVDYEDVLLEKCGSIDNLEFIRCGYSKRANILLIAESERR